MLAGIDACKAGWMIATYDGSSYSINIFPSFVSVLTHFPNLETIFIDIPIGLASQNYKRTVDSSLRQNLKGRASTVFTPPCREVLDIKTHTEASAVNRKITDKGLSIQSFNIMHRIRELDSYITNNPKSRVKIFESHPELCFMKLNHNEVLKQKKSSLEGIKIRQKLIDEHDSALHSIFLNNENKFPSSEAKKDDILDALVLLLANKKCHETSYSFLSDENKEDEYGIPMKIAFFEPGS